MTNKKKRKLPAGKSKAIKQRQTTVTNTPAVRLQKDTLSGIEAVKLEAAISNNSSYGWETTANLKIAVKSNQTVSFYSIVISLFSLFSLLLGSRVAWTESN